MAEPVLYFRDVGIVIEAITPMGVYKLVRRYALGLGLKIRVLALRATVVTNYDRGRMRMFASYPQLAPEILSLVFERSSHSPSI